MRKTLRWWQARVGHAKDEIGLDGSFASKLSAHLIAHGVDRATVIARIGAREVDMFEDAARLLARLDTLLGL